MISGMNLTWATLPAVVGTLLLTGVEGCSAREPAKVTSEQDQLILQSFLKHAADAPRRFTPEVVAKIREAEDICWVWVNYARLPQAAYLLTGDTQYLDGFVKGMDGLLTRLRKGPDGYLGFRGLPLGLFRNPQAPDTEIDVDIAEFEVARLIAEFVESVRAEAPLKANYGEKADAYLKIAEEHLAGPKWDTRKLYMDLGPKGAVFRMPAECGNNRDSLTNPHNKQSKMCRAYLALYRATGKDDYFRRALKLGTRFKRTLRLEDDHYLWNYWEPSGEWDQKPGEPGEWKHWIGPEHRGGYHGLTVAMAEALFDHGVLFDRADVQRFVNTQMQICWNGSLENPVFVTTGGQPAKEASHATIMAPALARFEPKVWEYCYGERATKQRLEAREQGWPGGVGALSYLMEKYGTARTAEPTRTRFRDQFLAKPGNAAFLKSLDARIGAGGR